MYWSLRILGWVVVVGTVLAIASGDRMGIVLGPALLVVIFFAMRAAKARKGTGT